MLGVGEQWGEKEALPGLSSAALWSPLLGVCGEYSRCAPSQTSPAQKARVGDRQPWVGPSGRQWQAVGGRGASHWETGQLMPKVLQWDSAHAFPGPQLAQRPSGRGLSTGMLTARVPLTVGPEDQLPDQASPSSLLPRTPTTATWRGGDHSPGMKLLRAAWHLPLLHRRLLGLQGALDLPAVAYLTRLMG